MTAKQKVVHGRGPSNINLSIFVCSFDVCRASGNSKSKFFTHTNLKCSVDVNAPVLHSVVTTTSMSTDFPQEYFLDSSRPGLRVPERLTNENTRASTHVYAVYMIIT